MHHSHAVFCRGLAPTKSLRLISLTHSAIDVGPVKEATEKCKIAKNNRLGRFSPELQPIMFVKFVLIIIWLKVCTLSAYRYNSTFENILFTYQIYMIK